jgi:hypothetical protein
VANSGTSSAAVFDFTIPRGDKGDKGDVGNTGATGATGSPGTAATATAGTTTTGAPGTSASVVNAGTTSAAVFNFTIPRGDVGATGATGATGAVGPGVAAGGTTGQFLSKASGTNYDTTWATIVPGDRYLTTSTTSLTINNSNKTLTVGTGLSYTPTQNVTISYDASNHMHGEVLTYNTGTGAMTVDVNHHTGSGTYAVWVVNVGGVTPVTSTAWGTITGTLSAQTDLQTALDAKAALASPTFTGVPAAPTATAGTNTTQLATTAFVTNGLSSKANLASPTFTGTVTIPAGASISGFAPLASPALTGTPTAPTATAGTSTTQLATTAFVTAVDILKANIASPTFTGTVTIPAGASISGYLTTASASSTYAPLASPTFTGDPKAPTPATLDNDTSIATTAFVKAQGYATLASPTFTGTVTIPAGASISGYLTTSSASSTYQTLSGMSSYLTTSAAASTYQTQAGMSSYLTTSAASSTYYPLTNPSGFITSSALTGYATESWVTSQGYLTDAPSDGNEYVRKNAAWAVASAGGGVAWGSITGTLSSQTDLQTELDAKLDLAGGAMNTDAEVTIATTTDRDSLLAGWGLGVQKTSDNTKGTTVSFDGLDTYDGSSHMIISPTGITFPDATTMTTAPAGSALAADQLTAGVVTANPVAGPTTAGDVLQYDGTDLIWAAGGGGGGVAWGAITGTVTDQTDLVTYVTGLGYQTASDVSTYVTANAYPLTGNPSGFLTSVPGKTVNSVDLDVAAYTLVISDANNIVNALGDGSSSGYYIYIPLDSNVAFPIGTEILFTNIGTGYNYINGVSGVTIVQTSNGLNPGYMRKAVKLDTDTWLISVQI